MGTMTTTLTAAITRNQAFLPVHPGLNPGLHQIGGELVTVVSGSPSASVVEVIRGALGTYRDTHLSGVEVTPLVVVGQTGQPVVPPVASEDSISGANMSVADPTDSAPGDVADPGSGPEYSAFDHLHGREAAGTVIAAVAGSVVAGGTGATGGAWDTAGHRDTTITTITEIKTQLNALIVQLKASGYIASS